MTEKGDFQDVDVNDGANDDNDTNTKKESVIEVDNDNIDNSNNNKIEEEKSNEYSSINLIRPQRTASPRTLKIINTEERKGRVQKHTVYIIECDPSPPGVITVARRYNDFKWLRGVLCSQFPGLFVPPLPPANVIGRFENSFIEERRQDLERFLNRIEEVKPFAECMAFGMFLSRPETTFLEGRKEVEEQFGNRNEEDIALMLSKLFPDLAEEEEEDNDDEDNKDEFTTIHEEEIPNLVEFLNKIDQQMTLLNKSAIRLFKHLNFVNKEMLLFEQSFDGLYSAESNYPYKATSERLDVRKQFKLWSSYQTKQTDSYYDNFFRSLRYEHEDIRSLLELFKYHDDLYTKKYKKVCKSIEKWQEMETNGVELKPAQDKQKNIDFENRKQLTLLLNIITKIILKNEIVLIWNNKTSAWRDKIQQFAKIQTQITNKMLNNWKNVAQIDESNDNNNE